MYPKDKEKRLFLVLEVVILRTAETVVNFGITHGNRMREIFVDRRFPSFLV